MGRFILKTFRVFGDEHLGFSGNTSTVVLHNNQLSAQKMQEIAADTCQPATTFIFPLSDKNHYGVRWYAPDQEIEVCGHGAAAAIAFLGTYHHSAERYAIQYKSGTIYGSVPHKSCVNITVPSFQLTNEVPVSKTLLKGIGIPIISHFKSENKDLVLVKSEKDVLNMKPDFKTLQKEGSFGYVITAQGDKTDFVSRTLIPHVKQLEDPATGSSHAILTPFWASRLGKDNLIAHQLSDRGGKFRCLLQNQEVQLEGQFQLLMEGELIVE